MDTELVTLIFGPYLEPVVIYRSSVLPIWACAWIHLWEFAASLQQHPCMKLCSQTQAHWFCWHLFQVIVIAACDDALSALLCSSVKMASKWRRHVSHWNHTPQNSYNFHFTIKYIKFLQSLLWVCTDIDVNCNVTGCRRYLVSSYCAVSAPLSRSAAFFSGLYI